MSAPTPHPQQPGGPSSFGPPQQGHPGHPGHAGQPAQPGPPPYGAHGAPQVYPTAGYPAPSAQPGVPPAPRKSWFARHKILTGVGVVVLLAIIGSVLDGAGEDQPTPPAAVVDAPAQEPVPDAVAEDPAESAPEEPAAEPAPEAPAAVGIGVPVRDGKFEFTVTSVEPGVPSVGDQYLSQEAQGQYVLVRMTVKNIGDEAQMFTGGNQQLTDTEGRTHESDTTAAIYLGDANSFLTDINPGNAVEGVVVFDIPADAVPATLSLHDSMFSGGVEVSLG
ncbi:hypothetical protein CBR64_05905 [Cellulosimicrobium cellulans]|jgi:hypothetical protein|uniref:DUF4352 domain-containing protein n=1 Tax=Cellulosimicrobium cellulans TaxID=1710 RepID=A0A1Y0HUZ1_CELCE|nr:DUF4352 domain-containing protein [Cellulosimicrobium cellulans]ARU51094.1 hypothetical protein CBR64_05905 [Cellulosimicrobium cellulans]